MPGVFENRRVADVRASAAVHNRYSCGSRCSDHSSPSSLDRTVSFETRPMRAPGVLNSSFLQLSNVRCCRGHKRLSFYRFVALEFTFFNNFNERQTVNFCQICDKRVQSRRTIVRRYARARIAIEFDLVELKPTLIPAIVCFNS